MVMGTRSVIVAFGGIAKMARTLRHRNPSTVQGWWERQVIPSRRFPSVLAAAQALDIQIGPADLIPEADAERSAISIAE